MATAAGSPSRLCFNPNPSNSAAAQGASISIFYWSLPSPHAAAALGHTGARMRPTATPSLGQQQRPSPMTVATGAASSSGAPISSRSTTPHPTHYPFPRQPWELVACLSDRDLKPAQTSGTSKGRPSLRSSGPPLLQPYWTPCKVADVVELDEDKGFFGAFVLVGGTVQGATPTWFLAGWAAFTRNPGVH
ncbi:hypothetical protein TRIUR3_18775 [Triticum urartu]|uniref:Uncharacterized protein n=1 Tax=Triticum urartu TaxID=4572 RepID=M7Z4S9_TRIUA|nr:hypothetical protein TRIUR3_18775 [Triticum urartu]